MSYSGNRNNGYSSRGFTLLEVLIAMVIFGMTVTMLLSSMNSQNRSHVDISQRVVAHWVAMNKMAEVRIEGKWPSIGVTRGDMEMRNHKWYWLQTVSKTTEAQLRQVEIEVRLEESDEIPTTRFVGFIAQKEEKTRE
ncbi:type II secretion system minor pseudopilin GspI [Aliikangiella coralliicola]|uniref:Type II secretion system protein I n=1 Tax=Aliikangiella coralliicola TaxID=2592383 RepID=A0A545U7R4_9GAMM|nr:type II secretion system minor pseudopilin GspI [Aliikangiella coralliicola]TQV85501.1 type II secretion system protein GspI [Aliikangiella coralliicola]